MRVDRMRNDCSGMVTNVVYPDVDLSEAFASSSKRKPLLIVFLTRDVLVQSNVVRAVETAKQRGCLVRCIFEGRSNRVGAAFAKTKKGEDEVSEWSAESLKVAARDTGLPIMLDLLDPEASRLDNRGGLFLKYTVDRLFDACERGIGTSVPLSFDPYELQTTKYHSYKPDTRGWIHKELGDAFKEDKSIFALLAPAGLGSQ
jgi:hypothetical protein